MPLIKINNTIFNQLWDLGISLSFIKFMIVAEPNLSYFPLNQDRYVFTYANLVL